MSKTISTVNLKKKSTREIKRIPNIIKYERDPDFNDRFKPDKITELIKEILRLKLTNVSKFQIDQINILSKEITETIRNEIKQFEWDRYKYIVNIQIEELNNQGFVCANKMFWDKSNDTCISIPYSNNNIFALLNLYVIYVY